MPLRPQGPIEVVDRATSLLRTRMGDFATISLAVQIPIWLVLALLLRDDWSTGIEDNLAFFWLALFPDPVTIGLLADRATDGTTVALVLSRLLPSLGLAFTGGACGILVHDWSRGRATTGGEALLQVARRLPSLVGLWAVIHALLVVTCIGLALGPLVFGIAAPLWAMEGLGPWSGVVRSFRLSLRRFWTLCLSIPVATLVAGLTAALLGLVGIPILSALTGGWVDAGGALATALAGALPHLVLDPLLATAMALIALDLKVQAEGYDLEVELLDAADRERPGA
ncbi:MAG: hypothetical protein ACR2JF_18840 [Iamia sp.]